MGEATHLSHAERVRLIQAGREALDNAGCSHFPIIVGTGAGSTRETVELTNEAAVAGADYALVIASGYFAGALTREALKAYWVEVSQRSPIPVMIYNCKSGFCEDIGIVYSFERPWGKWGNRFGFRLHHRIGSRMSQHMWS